MYVFPAIQLGISVFEREDDYQRSLDELRVMADKINAEFARDKPVVVLQVPLSASKLRVLVRVAAFGCR